MAIAIALAASAAAWALLAYRFVEAPYRARRAALEQRVAAVEPATTPDIHIAPDTVRRQEAAIVGKKTLWAPLVEERAAAARPPSFPELLKGVSFTLQRIGEGKEQRIKVELENGTRLWLSAGEVVANGVVLKSIADDKVTVSLRLRGVEYTETIDRQ